MGIFTSVLAGIILISSSVMASWSITGRSVNILSMSSYKTSIIEEYEVPTAVYPSDNIKKVVNIKNEGTIDTFVRVKVEKQWGTRGQDGVLVPDTSLDPDMIIIKYDDKNWVEKDGYWYYKEVLKAGKSTKHPLFSSYTLSKDAGNSYKGKDANIVVTMDSVQAAGGAILKVWGITEKDLGLTYVDPVNKGKTTKVIFTKSKKISFDGNGSDLFANFKNLLPGCSRTQIINLKNSYKKPVKFLLRSEAVDKGDSLSEEEKNLVGLLLSKYATITVKNGNSVIYKGSVDGYSNTSDGYTMSKDIDLGVIKSKGAKDLVVTLTMSPEVEEEFQSIQDKVTWVFTVMEDQSNTGNDGNGNNGNNGNGSGNTSGNGNGVTPVKPGGAGEDDSAGGSGSGSGSSGAGGISPISKGGDSGSGVGAVSAEVPKTSDNTDIALQIILLLGSLIVLVVGLKFVNEKEEV